MKQIKCVIVGDGSAGNKCFVTRFATADEFPDDHYSYFFVDYSKCVTVDGETVKINFKLAPGHDDFDQLCAQAYPNADIVLICFSIYDSKSFLNVEKKWIKKVRKHCPIVPIFLVGLKADLQFDSETLVEMKSNDNKEVSDEEGCMMSKKIKALKYFHFSSLSQTELAKMFDSIVREVHDPLFV